MPGRHIRRVYIMKVHILRLHIMRLPIPKLHITSLLITRRRTLRLPIPLAPIILPMHSQKNHPVEARRRRRKDSQKADAFWMT